MIYEGEKFTDVENVGFIDSVVRGSASIAILVTVMLIPSITAVTLFGLTQLAIYAGLTAFLGWDPIYAMMKKPKAQLSAQAPAAVATYSRSEEQPVSSSRKRAA